MSHLFLYCLDVHSLKDTRYSPTYGRVWIFQKVRDRKVQLETSLGERVWGLIYSMNSPPHMTSDIQPKKEGTRHITRFIIKVLDFECTEKIKK